MPMTRKSRTKPPLRRVPAIRTTDRRFHVLCLSQKSVRLFACSMSSCHPLPLGGSIPSGLDQTQRYTQMGKQQNKGHGVLANGQSGGHETEKMRTEEFIREVARGIEKLLAASREYLVVAGVSYETAMFRSLCRYPHVLEKTISGNPDHFTPSDVHSRAIEIMKEIVLKDHLL